VGFKEIQDNIFIKPRLSSEDLRLFRRAMIAYIKTGTSGSDEIQCKAIFKRMLRKVKL